MSTNLFATDVQAVKFKGHVRDAKNLSAVGVAGEFLLLAGDEDDRVQILRRHGANYELLAGREVLLNDVGAEADIEGIACEGDLVYVVGSHSCKRPKLKEDATRQENRSRLEAVEPPSPFRSVLARFRLASDGTVSAPDLTTLRPAIDGNRVLRPFVHLPCKENGVDVEGLAVHHGQLYLGFRGPVLQHGLVPVLVCPFPLGPVTPDVVYLRLGGLGIRDLVRVSDGFLVLAGPVNDVPAPFRLFHWDGADCTPGDGSAEGRVLLLGEVPAEDGAKAEGLALERETDDGYVLLVLFDDLKEGGATRLRVNRSNT